MRPFTFFACKYLTVLLATGMTCAGAEKAAAAPKEPLVRRLGAKPPLFYSFLTIFILYTCCMFFLFYSFWFVLSGLAGAGLNLCNLINPVDVVGGASVSCVRASDIA
jgi:hypothetical protein